MSQQALQAPRSRKQKGMQGGVGERALGLSHTAVSSNPCSASLALSGLKMAALATPPSLNQGWSRDCFDQQNVAEAPLRLLREHENTVFKQRTSSQNPLTKKLPLLERFLAKSTSSYTKSGNYLRSPITGRTLPTSTQCSRMTHLPPRQQRPTGLSSSCYSVIFVLAT